MLKIWAWVARAVLPWPLKLALGAWKGLAWVFADSRRLLAALLALAVLWAYFERRGKLAAQEATAACAANHVLAVQRAEAATAQAEANNRSINHAAQISFEAGRVEGSKRFGAFVAANRVRDLPRANPRPAAQADVAGVRQDPAAQADLAQVSPTLVAVEEAELQKCDVLYDYGRAWFEWGQAMLAAP